MATASATIQPRAQDALDAVRHITAAADALQVAAQQLDRVPGFFIPDISPRHEGVTVDAAADLHRIADRIGAQYAVML